MTEIFLNLAFKRVEGKKCFIFQNEFKKKREIYKKRKLKYQKNFSYV